MRTSNVGKLAGAIAAQMREHGEAAISVVGPVASYMAVKSIVICNKYLADTLDGKDLGFYPEKLEITGESATEGVSTVGMMLHIRPVAAVTFGDQPEIFAAGSTNVGLLAGLISNRFKSADVVTVGGMGANAVSSALKATMIAQRYMEESLGKDEVLVLVPKFNEFEEHDEQRMRMLLGCTRVPR